MKERIANEKATTTTARLIDARLRLAVEDGDAATAEKLLTDGADPDLPGLDGMSAALIAELSGQNSILAMIDMHRSVRNRLSQEKNARPAHWEETPRGFTVVQARAMLRMAVERSKKPAPGDVRMVARLAKSLAAVDSPEAVAAVGDLMKSTNPQYRQQCLQAWAVMECPAAEEALKRLASFWTMGRHHDKTTARKILKRRGLR